MSLLAAQRDKIEEGLRTALSIHEEQARVHDDLAERHRGGLAGGVSGSHERAAGSAGASSGRRGQRAAAEEIRGAAEVIRKHFPDIVLDN